MKRNTKIHHFVGAITHSAFGLFTGLILVVIGYLALSYVPTSEVVSLFVGTIGSIVASIIYSVADKYSRSCSSFGWILDQIEVILAYIDEVICDESSNNRQCKFELWRFYIELCEKSYDLTYGKDFETISTALVRIIKVVNQEEIEGDSLECAKRSLISVRNKFTE